MSREPEILNSEKEYNVRTFGASGDGATRDTAALQSAIDACHRDGGGRVTLPKGVYLTDPLYLRSNVNLCLAKEAVLLGSADPLDYHDWKSDKVNAGSAPYNSKYLILAEGEENIAITGEGTIDGQSFAHYERPDPSADWWRIVDKKTRPGRMICFLLCRNVRVEGVTCQDAPAWTFWVAGCDGVVFHNVTITTDHRAINTDGIDIDCCRDVAITHCNISTGDDAIVLRAIDRVMKEKRPCEQVRVENCTLQSRCNAIRLSYLRDGTIRNAVFNNITIHGSRRGIICQVPSPGETPEKNYSIPHAPGPVVENIVFSNIRIEAIQPIWLYLSDTGCAQRIANFRFENIVASGSTPSVVKGNESMKMENVVFRNVRFQIVTGQPAMTGSQGLEERALALALGHCENVTLSNVVVEGENEKSNAEVPVFSFRDASGIEISEVRNRTLHPHGQA